MIGSKGQILHPWGENGYQEDQEVNFGTVDKRPHLVEAQAKRDAAERVERKRNHDYFYSKRRIGTTPEQASRNGGEVSRSTPE
jgi:hypothetical protein